jgi:hypothetical protein
VEGRSVSPVAWRLVPWRDEAVYRLKQFMGSLK